MIRAFSPESRADPANLRVYLLGTLGFDAALHLQQALLSQVAEAPQRAALILCEHEPIITVGRQGSPGAIQASPEDLRARRWAVRWVNRGGGCLLHLPGQLAIYPILPLGELDMGLEAYLGRLHDVLVAVLDDFGVRGEVREEESGVWVGNRLIAGVGVAVRDWVSYFGAVLNVDPDLPSFRLVRTGRPDDGPMTSLARERRGPLRHALVRERFLEHFHATFPFEGSDLFFSHPLLRASREL
jgi:lipoyl(octanoyl) transferase